MKYLVYKILPGIWTQDPYTTNGWLIPGAVLPWTMGCKELLLVDKTSPWSLEDNCHCYKVGTIILRDKGCEPWSAPSPEVLPPELFYYVDLHMVDWQFTPSSKICNKNTGQHVFQSSAGCDACTCIKKNL